MKKEPHMRQMRETYVFLKDKWNSQKNVLKRQMETLRNPHEVVRNTGFFNQYQ